MKPIDCRELYKDPKFYDAQNEHYTRDIPFYLNQAVKYGDPIIEIACGTGRLAIPLAQKGFTVTGVDASEEMLQEAKRKADSAGVAVEWICGDCRSFSSSKKFKLAFIAFNSIAHLHDLESIRSFLTTVKGLLHPEGRFIVDLFVPDFAYLTRPPGEMYPVASFGNPYGEGKVVISETNTYDPVDQINHIQWYYRAEDRESYRVENNMRIFFPQELQAHLFYNGFAVEKVYGDFDESPIRADSPRQIFLCRAARS